jgi:hypothetical protein
MKICFDNVAPFIVRHVGNASAREPRRCRSAHQAFQKLRAYLKTLAISLGFATVGNHTLDLDATCESQAVRLQVAGLVVRGAQI